MIALAAAAVVVAALVTTGAGLDAFFASITAE